MEGIMRRVKTCGPCLVLALVLVALPTMARAQAEQRPIEDFIAAQEVGPPTTHTPWYDPATDQWLLFDAFGTVNQRYGLNLATSFEGRVTVRPLADGRAQGSVVLHTRNGLCWGYLGGTSPANLVFGNRPLIVQGGAAPALGDAVTRIEFTMPSPDAPLPDVFQDLGTPDYPLESFAAVVNCDGDFRAPASGYPDGTPAKAHTTQTGLFSTGVPSGCPPEKDASCFPAEIVNFRPIRGR
jgi:hypothetical protein